MQIKEFLDCVCEQIKYKPIRKSIAEELQNHIEESKENYMMQEGLEEQIATEKVIMQMGEAQEIGKKLNKIHRPKLDWKLTLILIILLCFSGLVVFIKSRNDIELFGAEGESIKKFVRFVIMGIMLSIPIYFVNYTKISKYSNLVYLLATLFIVWALLFGCLINGIPYIYVTNSIVIAPTVVATPLYIIAFVGFINDLNKKNKLETAILKYTNIKVNINLLKIIVLSVFSLILLELIPSIVSVFVLGLIYLILGTVKILQKKENKIKNIVKLWGAVTLMGIFLLIIGVLPYKWERLAIAINPERDPKGGGWVAMNRKTIIESAKLWGEAENTSDAIDLFDEGTNFAFISVLAHYGWIVSIGIVLAIIAFSIKLILNAIKIKDSYGKLLIIGVSSMFILQSILNILMNLNLWVEAAFNLPFVSYGGGNLIINMMSLSLILSIYRRKDIMVIQSINENNKIVNSNN